MAYIFDGPELLYRTRHEVIGTPYHRNDRGILDTYDFFSAADPATALAIATRRQIDLVLICPTGSERLFHAREGEDVLLDRLSREQAPPWLVPVELPQTVATAYRLFEMARP